MPKKTNADNANGTIIATTDFKNKKAPHVPYRGRAALRAFDDFSTSDSGTYSTLKVRKIQVFLNKKAFSNFSTKKFCLFDCSPDN